MGCYESSVPNAPGSAVAMGPDPEIVRQAGQLPKLPTNNKLPPHAHVPVSSGRPRVWPGAQLSGVSRPSAGPSSSV